MVVNIFRRIFFRKFYKICIDIAFIGVLILSVMIFILYFSGTDQYDGQEKIVMILASGFNKEGELSQNTCRRLDKGIEISSDETVFIVTGGLVYDGKTEAQLMRNYLEKHSISKDRIIVENQSQDTYENLRNSLSGKRYMDEEIVIVSSRFHLMRIRILLNSMGYTDCHFAGSSVYWKYGLYCYIREIAALLRELYLGRLSF